jgi:hypothetical protein
MALGLAVALGACTQVPTEKSTDPKYAANGEPLICERVPVPGKIYPGKICMTQEQWDNHQNTGREGTAEAQRRGLATGDPLAGS